MSRYIILVERDEQTVLPVIYGDDGPRSDCIAIFPTREEAEVAAFNNASCQAWGYDIVDLDEVL